MFEIPSKPFHALFKKRWLCACIDPDELGCASYCCKHFDAMRWTSESSGYASPPWTVVDIIKQRQGLWSTGYYIYIIYTWHQLINPSHPYRFWFDHQIICVNHLFDHWRKVVWEPGKATKEALSSRQASSISVLMCFRASKGRMVQRPKSRIEIQGFVIEGSCKLQPLLSYDIYDI